MIVDTDKIRSFVHFLSKEHSSRISNHFPESRRPFLRKIGLRGAALARRKTLNALDQIEDLHYLQETHDSLLSLALLNEGKKIAEAANILAQAQSNKKEAKNETVQTHLQT